jgi:hypothetical protein
MKWHVEIVEISTGNVERKLTYGSERMADKALTGVLSNLNTDEFFVRTVKEEEK